MPNSAKEYLQEYVGIWQRRGVRAWEESWWQMPRETGDRIARLMNAPPDSVTMMPNVTSAQATIQSCFDLSTPRNRVVMVDMEFPSVLYIYREWLRGRGELTIVESDDGISVDTQRVIDTIDERTLLVPLSHVLFRSSFIMDAKAIIAKAHRVGAMVVLDVFQSLGVVPVDIRDIGADFAVGGCLKWLCGGPGACFLYVNPDIRDALAPRLTGWMAHEYPFGFEIGQIRYASGSYKFLNGTPNVPALFACRAGLEILNDIGVDPIRERSIMMTTRLVELALENGWKVSAPMKATKRAGTIAVDIPHAGEVSTELKLRNVLVDYRPAAGIRLSPHFYNTDDEIEHAISQIRDIVDSGAWKRHSETHKTVT